MRFSRTGGKTLCGFFFFGLLFFCPSFSCETAFFSFSVFSVVSVVSIVSSVLSFVSSILFSSVFLKLCLPGFCYPQQVLISCDLSTETRSFQI